VEEAEAEEEKEEEGSRSYLPYAIHTMVHEYLSEEWHAEAMP
jgi:hypothetical protein